MHQRDILQDEIKNFQKEIIELKASSDLSALIKWYEAGVQMTYAGYITIFFKNGNQPIITEITSGGYGSGFSCLLMTPTTLNGVDIQSASIYSQSSVYITIKSTRPIDHITRA